MEWGVGAVAAPPQPRHRAMGMNWEILHMTPFLCRFQEAPAPASHPMSLGTMTKTAAREEPDQDPSRWPMRLGTGTFTEAREEPDQDPSRLSAVTTATGTRTDSREQSDADPAAVGWALLPRA